MSRCFHTLQGIGIAARRRQRTFPLPWSSQSLVSDDTPNGARSHGAETYGGDNRMHTYVGLRPSRDKEAIHTFSGWKWSEKGGPSFCWLFGPLNFRFDRDLFSRGTQGGQSEGSHGHGNIRDHSFNSKIPINAARVTVGCAHRGVYSSRAQLTVHAEQGSTYKTLTPVQSPTESITYARPW